MSQKDHAELLEKAQELREAAHKHGGQMMTSLTRRNLFRASGAGVGLLAATAATREARAQNSGGVCSISSNFNGTPIPAGDWIWFNSVLNVHGLGNQPVTIGFMSSIQFTLNGTLYVVPVPSALVTFSPFVTLATTVFTNGQWVTVVPISHLAGNVYLAGAVLQSPTPGGFPGGIQPVTWQGMFVSMTPGLNVQWQWAAAVYNNPNFGLDLSQLGVKPTDDNKASVYQNSDHAGTPELWEPYVVGGAAGGGGSNFTGSYSGTAACTPIPATMGGGS